MAQVFGIHMPPSLVEAPRKFRSNHLLKICNDQQWSSRWSHFQDDACLLIAQSLTCAYLTLTLNSFGLIKVVNPRDNVDTGTFVYDCRNCRFCVPMLTPLYFQGERFRGVRTRSPTRPEGCTWYHNGIPWLRGWWPAIGKIHVRRWVVLLVSTTHLHHSSASNTVFSLWKSRNPK